MPFAFETVTPLKEKPKVAVVLGSGGPRGYAHIGILKVLEEHKVDIDLMVGSSVGALIGAFWAAGFTAEEISVLSKRGGPLTLFDLTPFAKEGWIKGQKLQNYVNNGVQQMNLEEFSRPLIVVATRQNDLQPVFFNSGNTGVAVRASSAVKDIISPVGINGVTYIDGDESLPVAVEAAKQAGADFVIAIDVSADPSDAPENTSEKRLNREKERRRRIEPQLNLADFVMRPPVGYSAGPWRSYFIESENIGELYAREKIDELLAKLDAIQVL
ncbi:MAG: patatin-like phospholipase family protein [Pseudomonadota bacterium]